MTHIFSLSPPSGIPFPCLFLFTVLCKRSTAHTHTHRLRRVNPPLPRATRLLYSSPSRTNAHPYRHSLRDCYKLFSVMLSTERGDRTTHELLLKCLSPPSGIPFPHPFRFNLLCKRSTGHTHTHTHTPTENNTPDTDTHTHTARTTPQTPKRTPPTNT